MPILTSAPFAPPTLPSRYTYGDDVIKHKQKTLGALLIMSHMQPTDDLKVQGDPS